MRLFVGFPIRSVLIVTLFLFPKHVQVANDSDLVGWDLSREEEHIIVYTRKRDDQDFKDSRAYATIGAPPDTLAARIMNLNSYPEWMRNAKEGRILHSLSNLETIAYAHYNAPWPIADRDAVLHMKLNSDSSGTVFISVRDTTGFVEPRGGIVRVGAMRSHWRIEPSGDSSRVELELRVDPGGSIPAWLANLKSANAPFDTMKSLKDLIHARS
jgi:predicted nuclease of predicted toxin-antitoxin system